MSKTVMLAISLPFILSGAIMANDDTADSKVFPYDYEVRELDNGLTVIVIPTEYPNIVSLQIPVSVGARNEVEPGKSGFAHFFEHMMFRGTEKYPSETYYEILKNAGADQNAYTSDDLTNYHITFSKEDLERILELEADRFKNLKYSLSDFKTEAKAVLGEYNKNSANPTNKLLEMQRNAAFDRHTYKHTPMGFLEDIEDMPNEYEYSLQFFDRYYRPNNVAIILSGDLKPEKTFKLVEKYFGDWESRSFEADIPSEPEPTGPVYEHVMWETPTLPYVTVAFHGPAFSGQEIDMAVMDIIARIAFSNSSDIYQKLVVQEQKVDQLFTYFPDRVDPYLVTVFARLKDPADAWFVRDEILKTFAGLRTESVSSQELADIKSNLRYSFTNSMDNSESIASALPAYIAATGDVETVNRVYNLYDAVEASDVREKANQYFTDDRLVVVTLSHEPLPENEAKAGSIDAIVDDLKEQPSEISKLLIQTSSPIINFRLLFNIGATYDPEGKEGLAQLTASMLSDGGSESMKFEEIQKALYPMAATFENQVDKEMTVFTGTVHKDNLAPYYEIISGQLLHPAWSEQDFKRVKANLINALKINLRENNDEELGKEVLYEFIYENHPYGHVNLGHLSSLEKLTLDDVQSFYSENYRRGNLELGLAGDFSNEFVSRIERDFARLREGSVEPLELPEPEAINGHEALIIRKKTRANAVSFGFPISVTRSDPDFAALWLVRSYLGEHRSTNSHLFQRIREIRGMNYGDYAYIEYFPRGMFQFHPDPNLGRQQQIFQVWIRPVETVTNLHFATRVAMFEINKLLSEGMTESDFQATKNYLLKFVNILTKTQDRQLGYALDSEYYQIGEFTETMRKQLDNLNLEDVNRAIETHLQDENVKFVFITPKAEELRQNLLENARSEMTYQSDKTAELLAEDKVIQDYKLNFKPDGVKVIEIEEVFE